jgi:uncharacterized protein
MDGKPPRGRARILRVRRGWRVVAALVLAVILLWAVAPAARGVLLVANFSGRGAPAALPPDLPARPVTFRAADAVRLSGWLVARPVEAPAIILVHGFKGTRADMLPWARFLFAAGYTVLLYDSRGCGQSDGWGSALGTREADDVIGAVRFLRGRADLNPRSIGALGISLGAGIVLLAAAREPELGAVVADSAWTDERPQLARMASLPLGPLAVPALPYEPALVDRLVGARLEDTRPLQVIHTISPHAVLLIHSADDQNATTPLAGAQALFAAAGEPKAAWTAPSGGHTGALRAYPAAYQGLVLSFFATYLRTSAPAR